jgi:sigma-B regulation protein RsbU (phosphoserine phosphatase)
VLYTDGVSEAANAAGDMFDEERLYEAVAAMPAVLTAREVAERLLATLHDFLDGTEPQDDITLVVVKVPETA